MEEEEARASTVPAAASSSRPPEGEARTEKKLFAGAENEEDADLQLARVLQEQERELYFIAQHNAASFRSDQTTSLAFQERSLNSIQDESDGSDLNDEQFAARLQAQELHHRLYYDSSGQPVEFPENSAPQEEEKDEFFEDFTYEDLSTLGDSVGTVKVGLSQETLGRMRTVKYSSTSGEVAEEKCTICQVEFEEGEDVLLLPCKHVFHGECIAPWLAENKCCPVCKHELEA